MAPLFFATGGASPVIIASSNELRPLLTTASTGTLAPAGSGGGPPRAAPRPGLLGAAAVAEAPGRARQELRHKPPHKADRLETLQAVPDR